MSLIQKEIADFTVQCYQNNAFRAVTKADVLGKWSVFFFYPADFTFVCPTESCDTHYVHKAWHDASERIQKIQYPMLADPTHCLAKDFEVYIEADGVAERGSFIVNPEGKIVAYEVNAGNVGRSLPVCGGARGRGVPGQVAARRRNLEAQPGSGGPAVSHGTDGKPL